MNRFDSDSEIIDVAFRTASDDELFRTQPDAANQNEQALKELQLDVMRDPERCFCRNCGQPVYRNAGVCPCCNYVINPAALQKGSQVVRARREKYERGHKVFRFIHNLTGIDLESPEQKARWTVRPQAYHFQTTGSVYCINCGCEVDPGASVCVSCNYVLDPAAVQRAKLAIQDRTAKLSRKDLIKCLLIPGHGHKMFLHNRERRPQIASPSRIAGWINAGILTALAGITAFLIIFS